MFFRCYMATYHSLGNVLIHFCDRYNTSASYRRIHRLKGIETHWEVNLADRTSMYDPYEVVVPRREECHQITTTIEVPIGDAIPQASYEIIVQAKESSPHLLYCGLIQSITGEFNHPAMSTISLQIRLYPFSELFRLSDMLLPHLDDRMQPPDDRIADPLWYRIASDFFKDRCDNDMTERYLNVAYILERANEHGNGT